MERDKGGVGDFHQGSKYFDAPSPVNIYYQREGEKETDDGKDNGWEGSLMTGQCGETYLTSVDGTVYWVKEADDDYFLDNSVGDILTIGYNG